MINDRLILSILKIFLLLLTTFLASFARGWCQGPLHLSLKQSEDLAIQNNYQMNASLHRLEQGYYGYKTSQAYFLPKVNAASTVDVPIKRQNVDVAGEQRSVEAVVRLTQPLFDKTASYSLKEAQIQWEEIRLDVQQQICDLLFQVRDAYFTVLLHQAHLAVDRMIIQIWEEEIKRQERHLELGASIPYELNQTKLHLKRAWIDYYGTQSDVRSSQIKLLTILGLPPHTELHLLEKEIPLPENQCDFDQWQNLAFQYRPQLKQQQFSFLLSQNKIAKIKAERLPTFSLYASAGHQYVNNGFTNQPYVGVGVNVDWSLYDPSNSPRIKQAKEGSREAASNYYQAELETAAVIDNLLNELEKSHQAYLTAQEGAALAKEGMLMAIKKHQLGMMSSFEYRDAIKTLHEAQQQVNQAKFDVCYVYYQLIQQVGLDLEAK